VASTAAPGHRLRWTRGRHIVGPAVLLGAGLLLLLNNLQVVPWSVWAAIWPYWPVLLVLLSLEALLTGRVAWGTLVLLILLVPVVWLVVTASNLAFRWQDATRATDLPSTPLPRQTLGGATAATVEVEYGTGALNIGPLPSDAGADTLMDGQVFGHGSLRFDTQSTLQNGRRLVKITPTDIGSTFDPGRLDLRLSPGVPIDLKLSSGASESTLDLEALRIPNLSIETGASRTSIMLPAHGETRAQIEGGIAAIEVVVPPNVAARIMVDDGPNRVQIDERRFPRQRNEYRSPNFDTATDRVTLRIEVGASRLVVQ
jgi:hypothetical protein